MNVLELESVWKRYGRTAALQGVDLALEGGYLVGLVGPNGAGKTTLIKSILNLVRIDSGMIRVFGMDHRHDEREVRRRVGFVHESSHLFDELTARGHERIARTCYPRWDHDRFTSYLSRFALDPGAKVGTYSGGMRMKLALAMALSHNAELILMDEPTSGLDPATRQDLMDAVAAELENDGRSFIVSTHITSDLDLLADHLVVLLHGSVALSANREDLADDWALCRGGPDVVDSTTHGLFLGLRRSEYGFTAITSSPETVRRTYGNRVLLERISVGDLVVHLTREDQHENVAR